VRCCFCCLLAAMDADSMLRSGCAVVESLSALVLLSLAPSLMRLPVLVVVLTGKGRARENSLLGLRILLEGELGAAGVASHPSCALLLCCRRDRLSGLRLLGLLLVGLLLLLLRPLWL
jgi:hypothetical protein